MYVDINYIIIEYNQRHLILNGFSMEARAMYFRQWYTFNCDRNDMMDGS